MTLDKMGRVKLGPLEGVLKVRATCKSTDVGFKHSWKIINETDQWTESTEINIIQGEDLEIPINYEGPTDKLSSNQLSLRKV